MQDDYYIIKQTLPYIEANIIKIPAPANKKHIQELIDLMFGEIFVYYYTYENNQRQDLSNEFNVPADFNIYEHRFENTNSFIVKYQKKNRISVYLKFYFHKDIIEKKEVPKTFFMWDEVYFLKECQYDYDYKGLFRCDLEERNRKVQSGNEYEKFIANKYRQSKFEVFENGIKKSLNDGGIDLICINENKIILVQCKNWSMSKNYKINQKDLRAFIEYKIK